ncbi:acyl-ACP--UDP-N-acetylglucosamine O-acyltransferase [bacterium]|jgi:UDP-N-acetylglucosamine acyltransferase|nr:acyl-ACP--UDP-N-acetylglucosamine O-acyltransferase [bacterium]
MKKIHNTAIVSHKAELGDDVEVGPFCIIGDDAVIGAGTRLISSVNIDGITKIGKSCVMLPGVCVGLGNQDLKYKGEKTEILIGDNTTVREYATINSASSRDYKTTLGSNCLIMAYSHIGHDSVIGNNVVIANNAAIAGHVTIQDFSIIGGIVAIHQFCVIGESSIIGGCSKVVQDVLPFCMADGHPAKLYGVNAIGLKRRGKEPEVISHLKKAVRIVKLTQNLRKIIDKIKTECGDSEEIIKFAKAIETSERGFCR